MPASVRPRPPVAATYLPSAGVPALAGPYSGVFTLSGGGVDIWNAADQFQYASQTASGDQTLVARVTSQTDTASWAKAGAMFRDILPSTTGGGAGGEGTSAGAMCVTWLRPPRNGVSLQWRNATGRVRLDPGRRRGPPQRVEPRLAKLVKSGSTYTGFYSLDGATWYEVGSTSVTFSNSSYLAGLCVSSHNNGTATTATFDNASLSPSVSEISP